MSEDWTQQLAVGSILLHYETLYIVESGPSPDGDVAVGELGKREVKPSKMFDIEADCPAPGCSGEIAKAGPGHRECSEGCLEWALNHPTEGENCDRRRCEGGTIIEKRSEEGQYTITCTECERYAFGPEYWTERWQPYQKGPAINAYRDRHPDIGDSGSALETDETEEKLNARE